MTPLRLNERDVIVQGVVVGVIRKYYTHSRRDAQTHSEARTTSSRTGTGRRTTQTLERLPGFSRREHLARPRDALGVRGGEAGHVDRRSRVEQERGKAGGVVTSITEQALDARGVRRRLRAR